MSDFPTPKFSVGQKVWCADVDMEKVHVVCPDCADTRVWTATSPAGETFPFPCPRCTGHETYKMVHQKAVAKYRQLTIGTISVDTNRDVPVSYMCHETGIGSGQVWSENRLAFNEDDAKVLGRAAVADREAWLASEIQRRECNNGAMGTAERVRVAVKYHTFTTAEITEAKSKAWSIGYDFERLCNAIASLDDDGGIEGLDSPTLGRIVATLAEDNPTVASAREAVLYDRAKATGR